MTEDAVQSSVEDAFSSDFVFRSPRKEDGKEVTDILVIFDDVGLVIQSKAQALSSDGNIDLNRTSLKGKWARRYSPQKLMKLTTPALSVQCGLI